MQITALDAHALNPGDLSWSPVAALGTLTLFDNSPVNAVIDRAQSASILITNKVSFDAPRLAALPNLRLIAITATGYNIIDLAAARACNVTICNVPAYSTDSVAQHALALLLELTNAVGINAASVRAGEWQRSPDFAYWKYPLVELAGKKLGIVGFGAIGRKVAAIAHALGMNILVAQRTANPITAPHPITPLPLEALFAESDVITLHCPLTPQNARFVSATLLSKMKPTAILLNTSRGGLIDEPALAAALNSGTLAAYAADVLTTEPPTAGSPLITAKNSILTPHHAWATLEARQRCMAITAQNIAAFLAGNPINLVT